MASNKAGRYLSLLAVLISGAFFSFAAFHLVYKSEKARIESLLDDAAGYRYKYIEDEVQDSLSALYSLCDLYAASQSVERDEFDAFVQGEFLRHPYLLEFRWLPRVLDGQRKEFEKTARSAGLTGFTIREINKDEQFVTAGQRQEYFPVYYISHSLGDEHGHSHVFGLDAAVIPERWQAMRSAWDTGEPAMAVEIKHYGEADIPTASRIFMPIFRNNLPQETLKERRENLAGFAVLLFRVDRLVTAAFERIPLAGVDVGIYDVTSGVEKLLYYHYSRMRKKPVGELSGSAVARKYSVLDWSRPLNVAGRQWEIVCTPSREFLAGHKIILPWVLLAIGLILTLLLTEYLNSIIGKARTIELLVKQRTAELTRSEERLRVLYNSSRDAVMTLAPPVWDFNSANPAALELFGVKDEKDLTIRNPWELSPEYQPDGEPSSIKAKRMTDTALERGSYLFNWQHKKLSGEEFPAMVLLSRVESEGKVFLQASVRDITEFRRAEEALRQANNNWEDTFNCISDFVFILDNESTITKINKATLDLLHMKKEYVIGKKCYEIVHKSGSPWPTCPHQQTIADQKPHTEEVIDPVLGFSLLISTSPVFDERGEHIGSIHIAKDISGIKKTEEELRKAKKELEEKNDELKKLDQLKSQFVANVSHEFKNPLTIIGESMRLIVDGAAGEINQRQREVLESGKKTVDRLARLVTDLLDISKIEAGKMELKREKFDVSKLIGEIVAVYEREIARKQISLKQDIPDLGPLWADRDKITEVIVNLLNNAIKYTPQGGSISLKASGNEDQIRVEVSDTGPGIPREYLEKIFDKFERIAAEKAEGTGLGLSIAKDILRLHRGRVWLESEVGKGSRFIFTLPRDLRAGALEAEREARTI